MFKEETNCWLYIPYVQLHAYQCTYTPTHPFRLPDKAFRYCTRGVMRYPLISISMFVFYNLDLIISFNIISVNIINFLNHRGKMGVFIISYWWLWIWKFEFAAHFGIFEFIEFKYSDICRILSNISWKVNVPAIFFKDFDFGTYLIIFISRDC